MTQEHTDKPKRREMPLTGDLLSKGPSPARMEGIQAWANAAQQTPSESNDKISRVLAEEREQLDQECIPRILDELKIISGKLDQILENMGDKIINEES